MKRSLFLKTLTLAGMGVNMDLKDLGKMVANMPTTEKMPVLFLGHGSPMNAIEENEFVQGFRAIEKTVPHPQAIVCISAHWETRGTFVTAMNKPPTIHDFGGFPQALYEVQYPAPGNPELAAETKSLIKSTSVGLDMSWGLDHGAWSVIRHMYPRADIPIIQLSLDYMRTPQQHYELARELAALRNKGVLIIGSGNMVHNLRMIAWDKLNEKSYGYDWAIEANEKMKTYIEENNFKALINYSSQGQAFKLAIPSPDHFLPLIYTMALRNEKDTISIFNDKPVAGSLTMTSVRMGN